MITFSPSHLPVTPPAAGPAPGATIPRPCVCTRRWNAARSRSSSGGPVPRRTRPGPGDPSAPGPRKASGGWFEVRSAGWSGVFRSPLRSGSCARSPPSGRTTRCPSSMSGRSCPRSFSGTQTPSVLLLNDSRGVWSGFIVRIFSLCFPRYAKGHESVTHFESRPGFPILQ